LRWGLKLFRVQWIAEDCSLLPNDGSEKKNEIQGECNDMVALPFTPLWVIFSSHDDSSPAPFLKGTMWTSSSFAAARN
jgi:hypothetical protein